MPDTTTSVELPSLDSDPGLTYRQLQEYLRRGVVEGWGGPQVCADDILSAIRRDRATDASPPVPPLFDPTTVQFGRFLESDPPPRRYVFEQCLPLGISAILASMGGAGKSYLMLQFGFALSSGLPCFGWEVTEPGSSLILAGEDHEDELHRRGRALFSHYKRLAELAGETLDLRGVASRLHIVSRVGEDNLLTRSSQDGDVQQTALVGRLIEAARKIPDLRLIVLDPASRFRGGRANAEEDTSRYVEAAETIVKETGATVLTTCHVSQAGIREGGGQEIVRGSTASVDGVRWVATLQPLRRDQAKNYGLQEDEARRYLRLEIPKSNYTAPFPGLWLERSDGGVLVPTELEQIAGSDREAKAQAEYVEIVGRLQVLISDKGPMTRTTIRKHAGLSGALGAGDKTVRAVAERAVREGDLVDIRGELNLPMEGRS